MHFVLSMSFHLTLFAIRQTIGSSDKYALKGYTMVFQDTFTGDKIDSKVWSSLSEANRGAQGFPEYDGTNDLQCYIDKSVRVDSATNLLNIDTRIASDPSCPGKQYTSGRLTTFGKLEVT